MKPETSTLIKQLHQFKPVTDEDWLKLQDAIDQLWIVGEPQEGIEEMFQILEKYTFEEGEYVLWSILHGLESLPQYEAYLLESLVRQPAEFTLLMVRRILNANQASIDNQPVRYVIESLIDPTKVPVALQEDYQSLLARVN